MLETKVNLVFFQLVWNLPKSNIIKHFATLKSWIKFLLLKGFLVKNNSYTRIYILVKVNYSLDDRPYFRSYSLPYFFALAIPNLLIALSCDHNLNFRDSYDVNRNLRKIIVSFLYNEVTFIFTYRFLIGQVWHRVAYFVVNLKPTIILQIPAFKNFLTKILLQHFLALKFSE